MSDTLIPAVAGFEYLQAFRGCGWLALPIVAWRIRACDERAPEAITAPNIRYENVIATAISAHGKVVDRATGCVFSGPGGASDWATDAREKAAA